MCHAVMEVRYRNKTEPDQLLPMLDEEALDMRLESLKKNDLVERITIFYPGQMHTRSVAWDITRKSMP